MLYEADNVRRNKITLKNIRIWVEMEKRCEGTWLCQLLTLCGYQAWKGILGDGIEAPQHTAQNQFSYLDILLLTDRDTTTDYLNFAAINGLDRIIVSGPVGKVGFLRNNFDVLGSCETLDTDIPESLETLMRFVGVLTSKNMTERSTVLTLTHFFTDKGNLLSKAIYTVTEMFCSRRINYSAYDNYPVLIRAVSQIETWLENYIENTELELAYQEMFALTYLQNLINEGYIKARRNGGYDTNKLLNDANYLLNSETDVDAVHYLKLQILHNSVDFLERPEDILEKIAEVSAPEYLDRAAGEVGDIYREEPERVSKSLLSEYYEMINEKDVENYRSLYRMGLVFETTGMSNADYYIKAEKKYKQVINLISTIDPEDRTPQEFEYLCKAVYGNIKTRIEIDKLTDNLTTERRTIYQNQLSQLIRHCQKFETLKFWRKIYGGIGDDDSIIALMSEKMQKVQGLAYSLLAETELSSVQ